MINRSLANVSIAASIGYLVASWYDRNIANMVVSSAMACAIIPYWTLKIVEDE